MNAFYEHHHDSIRFAYRCFDRILLNGLIQPFQKPDCVVSFFSRYRELYPVSKPVLKDIARQYDHWVVARAKDGGRRLSNLPTTVGAMPSLSDTCGAPTTIKSLSF